MTFWTPTLPWEWTVKMATTMDSRYNLTLEDLDYNGTVDIDVYLGNDSTRRIIPHAIKYPRGATVFAAVCCVIFIIVGLLGNMLTMLALSRCIKLRNATTAFVISLCAADFLFCAINLPPTASRYIHERWLLGDTMCQIFPLFFYGNVGVSLMSMAAITINRYILINHYGLYDKIYRKRYIALMIAFCWVFSFAILFPPLFRVWGQLGYEPTTFSCTILKLHGRSPKKFLFVFGFVFPCVVIVLSYSCIFYRVRQSRQTVAAHTPTPTSPGPPTPVVRQTSQRADEIRLTRLMLVIFCSFLLCFLPLMIVNVFDSKMRYPSVHVLASVLAWMSSCINPFIYAGMNRQYRQAYFRLFCPHRRLGTHSTGSSINTRSGSGCSKTLVSDVFVFPTAGSKGQKGLKGEKENSL